MRRYRWLLFIGALLFLSACGFRLRGEAVTLPAEWHHIAISFGDKLSSHNGLVGALERRLQETYGVHIELNGVAKVPRIELIAEKFDTPVSALDTYGRASEYLLEYSVRFRFVDADGKPLKEPGRIYLRREQSYNSAHILAKQRESDELKQGLREIAADRIVERLASIVRQP